MTISMTRREAALGWGYFFLNLLLLPQLRKVSFTMTLPLVSVALSAALFLLCRYVQQGKAIHDDNQSII